jgi:hypothetical protein
MSWRRTWAAAAREESTMICGSVRENRAVAWDCDRRVDIAARRSSRMAMTRRSLVTARRHDATLASSPSVPVPSETAIGLSEGFECRFAGCCTGGVEVWSAVTRPWMRRGNASAGIDRSGRLSADEIERDAVSPTNSMSVSRSGLVPARRSHRHAALRQ